MSQQTKTKWAEGFIKVFNTHFILIHTHTRTINKPGKDEVVWLVPVQQAPPTVDSPSLKDGASVGVRRRHTADTDVTERNHGNFNLQTRSGRVGKETSKTTEREREGGHVILNASFLQPDWRSADGRRAGQPIDYLSSWLLTLLVQRPEPAEPAGVKPNGP